MPLTSDDDWCRQQPSHVIGARFRDQKLTFDTASKKNQFSRKSVGKNASFRSHVHLRNKELSENITE